MQQRQPMNIAVTSNIATDKNSLPLAIVYFVAIHGAWPSVVWMPDRPFMPRQWLRGRITKDFIEKHIAQRARIMNEGVTRFPIRIFERLMLEGGLVFFPDNIELLAQLRGFHEKSRILRQRNSRSRRSKPRRGQAP